MPEEQTEVHRQAFALADEIGLSRDERIELAEMLLKVDVTTWKGLGEQRLRRLIDAMQGFAYIHFLMQQRG